MNQEFLFLLLLIVVGYVFKRLNLLKEKDGEAMGRIIFNITLPALIIVTFDTVKIEPSLLLLTVIVLIYGIISLCLAWLVFRKEEKELKGTLLMLAPGYNVGIFAFPLVQTIWGAEGLAYFGMFDAGNAFILFGIVYIIGSYYSKEGLTLKPKIILKKFGTSIPLMTYFIVSILNYCHLHLPSAVIDFATILSKANMPLSFLLLGLYLNFKFEKLYIKPMIKFLLFRYGTGLLFGVILYFLLPFNEMFKYTILIGLLLPIGASILPFALEFKYSTTRFIGTLTNVTIIISMLILYLFANFIL